MRACCVRAFATLDERRTTAARGGAGDKIMWTEDDIKRLKQQEQDMLRQVGKAPRDEAKAIKAAKAAERAAPAAKVNRATLKAEERAWRAVAKAEQRDAWREWEQQKASTRAAKKAARAVAFAEPDEGWKKNRKREAKDDWLDTKATGKETAPSYGIYAGDEYEPRGGGCFSHLWFGAAGLVVLLLLFALAQAMANR